MHSLLSDQAGISDMDTCTQPVPKGPGELPLGYCVSYNLLVGTWRVAVARCLFTVPFDAPDAM